MSFIDRLARHWGLESVTPDPRSTRDAIAAFERRFGVNLHPDVRAFYERFNGLHEMDSDLNRFWPIDEIDTVPAIVETYGGIPNFSGIANRLPNASQYFAFADHSIWVYVYALRLTDDPNSGSSVAWIADANTFDILTDTFSGFWELYLSDPAHTPVA